MRSFTFSLSLMLLALPFGALADQFHVTSQVAAATLYPDSGTITRSAGFSVPEGTHDLIISDIPDTAQMETLSVRTEGAVLGGVLYREDFVPPRDTSPNPGVAAAKARIKDIERQIETVQDQSARARLIIDAAEIRIGFLNQLGRGDGLAQAGPDTLRALSKMVGEDALEARRSALDAEIQARSIERQLEDLNRDLEKAQQALRALDLEVEDRVQLVLQITAAEAVTGTVHLDYLVSYNAVGWAPTYEFRLTRGTESGLEIQRDVVLFQNTGENWTDVQLTLSTAEPSGQTTPSEVHQQRRYIVSPKPAPAPSRALGSAADLAEPVLEAPIMIAEESSSKFQTDLSGLSVTYAYGEPVSVASGADVVRLKLDSLSLPAEIFAHAVPYWDNTAFLMARFTNTSGEQLLPSDVSGRHLNDRFTGTDSFEGLAAGEEAELSFGPIDGLQLQHVVLDRNSGDRGFISKSNEQATREEFTVTNLTDEAWPMRVLGVVPYSEQEDLQITWTAIPEPSDTDVDKRRGILAWEFDLPKGGEKSIRFDTKMTWPEGMELR